MVSNVVCSTFHKLYARISFNNSGLELISFANFYKHFDTHLKSDDKCMLHKIYALNA